VPALRAQCLAYPSGAESSLLPRAAFFTSAQGHPQNQSQSATLYYHQLQSIA
jgi:hypothetical protein